MYCTKCGTQISDTSIFCSSCGNKINTENISINEIQTITSKLNNTSVNLKFLLTTIIIPIPFYFLKWMTLSEGTNLEINGFDSDLIKFMGGVPLNLIGVLGTGTYYFNGVYFFIINLILVTFLFLQLIYKNLYFNFINLCLNLILVIHPLYFLYYYKFIFPKLVGNIEPPLTMIPYVVSFFYLLSLIIHVIFYSRKSIK